MEILPAHLSTHTKQMHDFSYPKHRFLNKWFGFPLHYGTLFFLLFVFVFYIFIVQTALNNNKKQQQYYLPSHLF